MARKKPESNVITVTDVAKLYGANRESVRDWAKKNLIPHFYTPAGQLRFHRDVIEKLIAKGDK